MKMKTQIGGKTCYIYDCGSANVLLIQPVDDHDIEVLDSEVGEIKRLSGRDFTLAAFKVDDWNADLSPWEAPPVFGNEAFAGGAEATLKYVVEELIPQLKGGKDPELYIGGYSLAGFFAQRGEDPQSRDADSRRQHPQAVRDSAGRCVRQRMHT